MNHGVACLLIPSNSHLGTIALELLRPVGDGSIQDLAEVAKGVRTRYATVGFILIVRESFLDDLQTRSQLRHVVRPNLKLSWTQGRLEVSERGLQALKLLPEFGKAGRSEIRRRLRGILKPVDLIAQRVERVDLRIWTAERRRVKLRVK